MREYPCLNWCLIDRWFQAPQTLIGRFCAADRLSEMPSSKITRIQYRDPFVRSTRRASSRDFLLVGLSALTLLMIHSHCSAIRRWASNETPLINTLSTSSPGLTVHALLQKDILCVWVVSSRSTGQVDEAGYAPAMTQGPPTSPVRNRLGETFSPHQRQTSTRVSNPSG